MKLLRQTLYSMLCYVTIGWTAAEAELRVFVASSLFDLVGEVAEQYSQMSGTNVIIVPGASSLLARQIEEGAPADVFISANRSWMDHVVNFAAYTADRPILHNRLVLIGNVLETRVSLTTVADALGGRRLALADPTHVPAGIYAREALVNASIWPRISGQVVATQNVRIALQLVALGEAPYGIVYRSDALSDQRVQILELVSEDLHTKISYWAAIAPFAANEAVGFLQHFGSEQVQDLLLEKGFLHSETNR